MAQHHKGSLGRGLRDDGEPLPELPELPGGGGKIAGLRLRLIEGEDDPAHRVWNRLMVREHPQGRRPLVGAQVRYLIECPTGIVGAFGFGPPAYHLECRDQWVGWSLQARQQNRGKVIGLSRFLIRSGLHVPNLASQCYSLGLREVGQEWESRYGLRPVLVETYVDRVRYHGRSLAAARLPLWFLGLGAVSPFAVAFAAQAGRRVLWICAGAGTAIVVAGLLLPVADLPAFRDVNATDAVLRGIFFANGLLVASLIRKALLARANGGNPAERSQIDVLVVWMGCAIAAAVLLAPFPAVRHVLLALPPVMVLLARDFAPTPRRATGALVLTAALGVAVAVSDWRRADVYRTEARALSSAGTAWTVGHWGWQWYATQEGMREYEPGKSRFQPGELVVVPGTIHQQRFTAEDSALLHLVREESVPGNALDLVRTVTGAGGLYYYWAAVPWTLRWGAVEKFRIYEVRPARSSDLDGLATEGKRRSMD